MDAARPDPPPSLQGIRPASPGKTPRGDGAAPLAQAFDLLRVIATFLVVLYHASLSYQAIPMRLTLWPVYDPPGHVSMNLFAAWVNGFAMPLFFLAAGITAPAGIGSRGLKVFLSHRSGRLLRPLLFGVLALLPVCYILTAYGLLRTGRCTPDHILRWRFPGEIGRHLYGLAHLWFLEYLYLICVLWGLSWWAARALGRCGLALDGWSRRIDGLLGSAWRPLILAVPTALIFLADTDTILRVENDLVPNPSRVAHYLYFFAAGGLLARMSSARDRLIPRGRLYLALAALDFVVMSPMLLRFAAAPLHGPERVVFAALAALFPWLATLGALGVCLERSASKGGALRFSSEASFWVYLVHVPVILLLQAVLLPYAWPWWAKFSIVSVITVGLSLLSYEYVARYSAVGAIVNGARKRLKGPRRVSPELGWIATAAGVLLAGAASMWYLHDFLWLDNYHAVAPGKLYRSGRLASGAFRDAIARDGIRTVITFSQGSRHHWILGQKALCQTNGAAYHLVSLRDDEPPSPALLNHLASLLERSPRPILVQGYRGLDHCAFASALALLLDGAPPRSALGQFEARYAQFAGPARSTLGGVLLDYNAWLAEGGWPHTPDRLKVWARDDYRGPGDKEPARAVAAGAPPTETR